MGLLDSSVRPPFGFGQGQAEKVWCTMRGGSGSKGGVVYFDLVAGDAAVTASTNFGNKTNPTANVIAATSTQDGEGDQTCPIMGVLAQDLADDASGWVYVRGVIQALGGDTAAAGEGLVVNDSSELIIVHADSLNIVAIALETLADATLKWVLFDGINGFAKCQDYV